MSKQVKILLKELIKDAINELSPELVARARGKVPNKQDSLNANRYTRFDKYIANKLPILFKFKNFDEKEKGAISDIKQIEIDAAIDAGANSLIRRGYKFILTGVYQRDQKFKIAIDTDSVEAVDLVTQNHVEFDRKSAILISNFANKRIKHYKSDSTLFRMTPQMLPRF